MLAEHLQSLPYIEILPKKHKALFNLFKIPAYLDKCQQLIVPATKDHINTGVFSDGKRGPTQNAIFVDYKLLANTWVHLRPALATSTEALFTFLGQPQPMLRKSPMYMDKHKDIECSYARKQLGILINTRRLTI